MECNKIKLGCIIVTYNRLNKLKLALDTYDKQLTSYDWLIVVDNHSNEDTHAYLSEWLGTEKKYNKEYLRLDENLGGAAGFKAGLERAKELGIDWCLICDDDAYLTDRFLIKCKSLIRNIDSKVGAICSKVIYPNGDIQLSHRRYLKKGFFSISEINATKKDYDSSSFEINLFSFVGVCLRMSIIDDVGYPDDRYFIWFDDTDMSIRVNSKYKIVCFPQLEIIHDCDAAVTQSTVNFKEYYGYRNKLTTLKKYYPRRVYFVYILFLKLRTISNRKNKTRVMIINDSINDFKQGVLGKNEKYLPNTFKIID